MSDSPTILQRGGFKHLRTSQRLLARQGIQADVVRPPDCDPNS